MNVFPSQFQKWLLRAAIVALVISFNSCRKDDQNIGLSIQPESDILSTSKDTVLLSAKMLKADTIKTSGLLFPFIGNYADPDFGNTSTTFYTQFELPGGNLDLGNPDTLEIDSVVWTLQTTQSHYGSLQPQDFSVFMLAEGISADSAYYSQHITDLDSENLIEPGFEVVSVSDASLISNGDSALNPIRIRLQNTVGQNILDQFGIEDGPLSDDDAFQEFFKGLALQSNTTNGGLISIYPAGAFSSMNIYYRDLGDVIDTSEVQFQMSSNTANYFSINHDYSSASFADFPDSVEANDVLYLQGINGIHSKISLPEILDQNLTDGKQISLAELIIPVEPNSSYYNYSPPSQLFLYSTYDEEEAFFVRDMCEGLPVGGIYNDDLNAYVFNLTLHVTDIVQGEETPEFWIASNLLPNLMLTGTCFQTLTSNLILPQLSLKNERVVLCGPQYNPQNESENMRLILTYTE